MAVTSTATTVWNGTLGDGSGTTEVGGHSFDLTWRARSETGGAVTPETLIASAHASCFAMAFSHSLAEAGFPPERVEVEAKVGFDANEVAITGSELTVTATVPGIDDEQFQQIAEAAKAGCPVSKALAGIDITLASATLA